MAATQSIYEQLSAYLDGELTDAEAGAVRQAVEADPRLAAELKALQATRGLVHALPRQRAGEGFPSRVLAEAERRRLIGAGNPAAGRRFGWVRHLATAAVLLIAAGIGISVVATIWNLQDYGSRVVATGEGEGRPLRHGAPSAEPGAAKLGDREGKVLDGVSHKPIAETEGLDRFRGPGGTVAGNVEFRGGGGAGGIESRSGRAGDLGKVQDAKVGPGRDVASKDAKASGLRDAEVAEALHAYNRSVAKVAPELLAPPEAVAAQNVDIYTDRVDQTQHEVEKVLVANGVVQLTKDNVDEQRRTRQALAAANYYNTNDKTPVRAQYVAFVVPEQQDQIARQLEQIKFKQRVRQDGADDLAAQVTIASGQAGQSGRSGPDAGKPWTENSPRSEAPGPATRPAMGLDIHADSRLAVAQPARPDEAPSLEPPRPSATPPEVRPESYWGAKHAETAPAATIARAEVPAKLINGNMPATALAAGERFSVTNGGDLRTPGGTGVHVPGRPTTVPLVYPPPMYLGEQRDVQIAQAGPPGIAQRGPATPAASQGQAVAIGPARQQALARLNALIINVNFRTPEAVQTKSSQVESQATPVMNK